jgi:LysR family transcriptional regulator, nitrogen assimilation regulatory protein
MIDVRKLKHFLAIVEAGSLTRAADSLRVAQPALTHSLRSLEDELGVELFERHARGVTLTEFGRVLEEQGRIILREVDRTRALIKHRCENPAGTVALAVPSILIGCLSGILASELHKRLPDTKISVQLRDSEAAREEILDGDLDLALTYASINEQGVSLRPLVVEQLVVVAPAPKSHWSRGLSIGDLEEIPLILPPQGDPIRLAIDDAANKNGTKLRIVLEMASAIDVLELVKNDGLGTILPARAARELKKEDTGMIYSIVSPRIMCCLFLMTARNRSLSRAADIAFGLILSVIEELVSKNTWLGRFVGDIPSTAETVSIFANPD